MTPQMEMLLDCYEVMGRRYSKPKAAMNALVQWTAYQVSVDSYVDVATPVLTLEMLDDLYAAFDLELLRSDPWDHLGDLAHYLGLNDWLGGTYYSREEATKWVRDNVPLGKLRQGTILFAPQAGSGRFLLVLHNLGVDCIMTATESAAKPHRLLVINQKLYNLTLFALRGKSEAPFDGLQWLKANLYTPCSIKAAKQDQPKKELENV